MRVANFYGRTGYALLLGNVVRDDYKWNCVQIWQGDHGYIPETVPSEGDLLVSCHWPRLFTDELLAAHTNAVNLHPNLSMGYKVEDPVGRALKEGRTLMSVACHRMTQDPDGGEILAEHWRTIPDGSSVVYAYELLRPLYVSVFREAVSVL